MHLFKRFALVAALGLGLAAPAMAEQPLGSYWAYIGTQDLYNSKGARLSQPWQVLRQDRANYHRFGVSQPGDEWDPWFGDVDNRAAMERMIMNGSIAPGAARTLVNGGATVHVTVYRNSIRVTVSN